MPAASSAPHIQAVLISGYPEGRCRNARQLRVADVLDLGAVPVPVLNRAAAAGVDTSRLVTMNE